MTKPHLSRIFRTVCAVSSLAVLPAQAEVWGYIDAGGETHLARQRVDERYQLFFRGDLLTLKPASAAVSEEPAPAPARPPATTTSVPTLSMVTKAPKAGRYEEVIERHAAQHAVDPALVKAIVAVESGFEPGAVSPKGARGLMQVMPETAARYGVTSDRKRSAEQKLMDPVVNIQVGTRYLRDLLVRFADNITLAVAAYNAGETAVERHKNRVPPYPETIEYVKRVQRLYAALKTPVDLAQGKANDLQNPVARFRGTLLPQLVRQESDEPVL